MRKRAKERPRMQKASSKLLRRTCEASAADDTAGVDVPAVPEAPDVVAAAESATGHTAEVWPRHPQQSPRSARILVEAYSPATIIPYCGLTVKRVGIIPPSTM